MKKTLLILAGLLSFNAFANDDATDSDLKHRHARVKSEVKSQEAYDLINVDEKNPHNKLSNDGPHDSDLKSRHAREIQEGDGPNDSDLKKHKKNKEARKAEAK